MPAAETSFAGQMPSFNNAPLAIKRAPATFALVALTSVCFLLFYPLQWVGMLELFNFVPFRAAGGYVAFGEWGDWMVARGLQLFVAVGVWSAH